MSSRPLKTVRNLLKFQAFVSHCILQWPESPMRRVAEYLDQANRCLEEAHAARSPEEQLSLLGLVERWAALAGRAAQIDNMWQRAKDLGVIPPRSEMH